MWIIFLKMSTRSKHNLVVRDVSRNVERWMADVGKVLSKHGRTKADLGGLQSWTFRQPEHKDLSHSPVSVFRCPLSHKAMPMTRKQDWWQQALRRWRTWEVFSLMWRFMWNGVDHLGMGSKLLTQQEQDTSLDGGMWRLHKGPVIGEASRCKSRLFSVCDVDVCKVSIANRCLVVRVDIWPTRTTFHCMYLEQMLHRTVPRKLSKNASDLEKVKALVSHG